MPKYVIHIGPPKTGSKYLQSMLFHSRDAMLAQGINYADNWWTHHPELTHDRLHIQLREKRYAEVRDTFRQINSQNHRIVVLSCEAFEDLAPDELEVLHDAIGKNPVDVVYYCRRWCERIPSAWKQAIKSGLYPTLPEFYVAATRHAVNSGFINSSRIWASFASVFGRRSLRLVSYNNLIESNIDLFRHFAETFLKWQGTPDVSKDQIFDNLSPGMFDTEIMRVLNWIDHRTVGQNRSIMHIRFGAMRSALDTRLLEELMADDVDRIELSDGAEVFRLSWKEMQKYADCLLPRTWLRKRLFELRTLSVPYVRSNYLLKDAALPELYRLYRQLDAYPSDAQDST